MPNVIMLNVIYVECRKKPNMLSVLMLSAVMLSAVMLSVIKLYVLAPNKQRL